VLSETLQKGLDQYAIGAKLRAMRLKKKMGLVELGRHTGLSPALLSKIERGRMVPTLPTLLRIALVFSVGLEHFFTEPSRRPTLAIVRRADRKRFPERMGDSEPAYVFESLDFPALERVMNAYYVEFEEPGRTSRIHQHPGEEFLYLMEGRLVVTVGDAAHTLDAGDAMYFESSVPHAYQSEGRRKARAIVVSSPDRRQR
jgi:quercetin dioxygenase-like cupin family protein/DNA-binding XRE family transcriptional regulator